ncbi:hypothetical protein WBK31_36665 [Nonomuraea sp. N2-4H]|jgi:hypothetical protein|uniref:hypothetical protein n=1 Tax=unclassified Nonomuraea TaxID=2593643 RepID=UPI00324B01A5
MTEQRPERLDERAVAGRLELLEELLNELESAQGPTAELALDAIATLAGVYGEALARVVDRVTAASPELGASLADDVLLAHLFVLHGVTVGQGSAGERETAFIPLDALARRPAASETGPLARHPAASSGTAP